MVGEHYAPHISPFLPKNGPNNASLSHTHREAYLRGTHPPTYTQGGIPTVVHPPTYTQGGIPTVVYLPTYTQGGIPTVIHQGTHPGRHTHRYTPGRLYPGRLYPPWVGNSAQRGPPGPMVRVNVVNVIKVSLTPLRIINVINVRKRLPARPRAHGW